MEENESCIKAKIVNSKKGILLVEPKSKVSKFIEGECFYDRILELEEKSVLDGLTKAFNKANMNLILEKLLYNALRYKDDLSLILLDIDHFKKINDTYGHLAGDLVLIELANIIRESIRKSDIFGRIGGEEFLIALPNTKIVGALKFAKRLKNSIEKKEFIFDNKKIYITVSMGITSIQSDDSLYSFLSRADEALYDAKRKGRNRVEYR